MKPLLRNAVLIICSLCGVLFLWQYCFVPLSVNAGINEAGTLAYRKDCRGAIATLDNLMPVHSFLDAYLRLQYAYTAKECIADYPNETLQYATKGAAAVRQGVTIEPSNTQLWLFLGDFTATMAKLTQDPVTKKTLVAQATTAIDRALQLAPGHGEIVPERIRIDLIAQDYATAQTDVKWCFQVGSVPGTCYWYRGLLEIYTHQPDAAQVDTTRAAHNGFNTRTDNASTDLIEAYNTISDYQDLLSVYEQLIHEHPDAAQYHAALAFVYAKLGKYQDARQEAATFLKMAPDKKADVDAFLKTLPK